MSEDKLLTLAQSLVASGDLTGAEDALAARIKIHPIPVDALILLAEIRLNLGRPDEALKLLAPYGGHRHCADWLREYFIGERINAQATAWLNGIPGASFGTQDTNVDSPNGSAFFDFLGSMAGNYAKSKIGA